MPVGPDEADVDACCDTVASIAACEPAIQTVVLIDDGSPERDLAARAAADGVELVSLRHPLVGRPGTMRARTSAGTLLGLRWLVENSSADVLMKMDTDALVIAPFAAKLQAALADPSVGLVGSYDQTCNGNPRSFDSWVGNVQKAARRRQLLGGRRARRVRRLIREGRAAGYAWGEHVLACALAMPRPAAQACLAPVGDPLTFAGSELGDDAALGILVRRAGYRLAGHVGEGETFGVAWRGLPDSPKRLAERGYSVIHSVKNDQRWPEAEVRRHFARLRNRAAQAQVEVELQR